MGVMETSRLGTTSPPTGRLLLGGVNPGSLAKENFPFSFSSASTAFYPSSLRGLSTKSTTAGPASAFCVGVAPLSPSAAAAAALDAARPVKGDDYGDGGALRRAGGRTTASKQKNVSLQRSLGLYWALAKGKLTIWVSLSAMPGYLLALPGALEPTVAASLFCGTFLTSASAQAMNQLWEIDRDAKMHRTHLRPLPSGRLKPAEAQAFAAASGLLGLGVLCLGATPAAAAIAGLTMSTYVGLYTPMKVLTPYNTHLGAIAGSLPTLLGFAAALGGAGLVSSPWAAHAVWLFGMQTLWQMPHFYALAWLHKADYMKGGYRMFPLTDSTGHATAAMSKGYLFGLTALPWGAACCGLSSWMLPVGALVPTAMWWRSFLAFEKTPGVKTCRRFFLDSLLYLLATLGLFTAYAGVSVNAAPRPTTTTSGGGETTPRNGTDFCSSGGGAEAEEALEEEEMLPKAFRAPPPPSSTSTKQQEMMTISRTSSSRVTTTLQGPQWRTWLLETFGELCPHEHIQRACFGLFGNLCPFGSSNSKGSNGASGGPGLRE